MIYFVNEDVGLTGLVAVANYNLNTDILSIAHSHSRVEFHDVYTEMRRHEANRLPIVSCCVVHALLLFAETNQTRSRSLRVLV